MFSIKSSGFGVSPFGVRTFFLATGAGTNFPCTIDFLYTASITVTLSVYLFLAKSILAAGFTSVNLSSASPV